MDVDQNKNATQPVIGLIAGLAGVAKNGIALFLSRLELAALEISELRNHLLKLLWVMALAIMALWFTLAYGTVLLVYLTWDYLGWNVLWLITLGFFSLATILLFYAQGLLRQDKLALPSTMAEIKADREFLL